MFYNYSLAGRQRPLPESYARGLRLAVCLEEGKKLGKVQQVALGGGAAGTAAHHAAACGLAVLLLLLGELTVTGHWVWALPAPVHRHIRALVHHTATLWPAAESFDSRCMALIARACAGTWRLRGSAAPRSSRAARRGTRSVARWRRPCRSSRSSRARAVQWWPATAAAKARKACAPAARARRGSTPAPAREQPVPPPPALHHRLTPCASQLSSPTGLRVAERHPSGCQSCARVSPPPATSAKEATPVTQATAALAARRPARR